MLTLRALGVFNCSPTTPDDGWTYTKFTSLQCAGGLCRCGDPTHLQSKLSFWAMLSLGVYTFAFPAWIMYVLRWPGNKVPIKVDQILRAKRVEDAVVKECSSDAYTMRIRYH